MRKEAGCNQAKLENKITIRKSLAHPTFFGEPVSLNCQLLTVFNDKSRIFSIDEFLYSRHLSAR